jgi:hypothetical protein
MRDEAARLFDAASRGYLSDEIEAEKRAAIDQSIVSEIKSHNLGRVFLAARPWPSSQPENVFVKFIRETLGPSCQFFP